MMSKGGVDEARYHRAELTDELFNQSAFRKSCRIITMSNRFFVSLT